MAIRHSAKSSQSKLQWGRNLFVAECRAVRTCPSYDTCFNGAATCSLRNVARLEKRITDWTASMGPQLVRCGMLVFWWLMNSKTSLQWGRNLFVAECGDGRPEADHGVAASMGPQLVRCGMQIGVLHVAAESALQWGRNLFVAECNSYANLISLPIQASMGPQLVRCGMADTRHLPLHRQRASMGPQLVRCGMSSPPAARRSASPCFNGAATCSLRNVRLWCDAGGLHPASMGPQLVRCGMRARPRQRDDSTQASMGPQLVRCGMRAAVGRIGSNDPASMGPQLVRCGMKPGGRLLSAHSDSFNGAATCSLRNAGMVFCTACASIMLQWGRNLFVAE